MNQAGANRVGGLLMGFGMVFALGMMVLSLTWPSSDTPDPARGLVYAFDLKGGGVGYHAAFVHFFRFPVMAAGVILFNLGWWVTPKAQRGGANPYDRADKGWMKLAPLTYAPVSYGLGGLLALAALAGVWVISRA